jgi:hypothetical protein
MVKFPNSKPIALATCSCQCCLPLKGSEEKVNNQLLASLFREASGIFLTLFKHAMNDQNKNYQSILSLSGCKRIKCSFPFFFFSSPITLTFT